MASILLVEDDRVIATGIIHLLQRLSHAITLAERVQDGLQHAQSGDHALAIVDRMLPDGDGLHLVSSIRRAGSKMPVLILSALGHSDDRSASRSAGGDEYMIKPFAPDELAARVEALLNQSSAHATAGKNVTVGTLEVDLHNRRAMRAGVDLRLSVLEFRLLEYLLQHAGRTVPRAMLFEHALEHRFDPGTSVMNVHIRALRKKIEEPNGPVLIQVMNDLGYRFCADRLTESE